MREIKFRAWDRESENMISPCRCEIFMDGSFRIVKSSLTDYVGDFVLMQSTGLKDKNGKDIYEGDILYHKYCYSLEMSYETFWEEEKIHVKLPDFWQYLGSDAVENSPETVEEFVAHMEAIGNAHQNPELL